jgi:phosphoinositide-3-kinase, regulatory subunit 4
MGAKHTTQSVTTDDVRNFLSDYNVERRLYPGSGRMMRTFRLTPRESDDKTEMVAKLMWTTASSSFEGEDVVKKQLIELERIRDSLKEMRHIAPFTLWKMGIIQPTSSQRLIALLRPFTYTTLSDRLESRPFLTNIEKLCIIYQFLSALQAMHDKEVLHGFLTTENIGLTSWNYVVILDIASYKSQVALPDDDPSDYLYYYQEEAQHDNNAQRGKRCYLAPERFYSPKSENPPDIALTKAMDVFSAGCIMLETWLNGERALDLGDTIDYRNCQEPPPSLVQKFSKVDSSHLRAACRHMMSLNPQQRLSPMEYLHRLQMPAIIGDLFEPFLGRILDMAPDARIAVAASVFTQVLRKTHGIRDNKATNYLSKIIGPTMWQVENPLEKMLPNENLSSSTTLEELEFHDLLKETEELLRRLDNLESSEFDQIQSSAKSNSKIHEGDVKHNQLHEENVSETSPESLLIFTQIILANLRHVNKPSTKIVALQLIQHISHYSSDETRLQRLVPSAVFHLQDQDPLVRAMSLYTLTDALSQVQSFPPSDSKLFPQYIFKRVAHLLTDPSLVVRVAFSQCISDLAETSRRFLDIIHAVRLYEVIGGGSNNDNISTHRDPDLFGEHIVRLLDGPASKEKSDSKGDSKLQLAISNKSNSLIVNLYDEELIGLQDVVSRWIIHIATSEQSSAPKQALLKDLARICHFFGRERVMEFILPQILAFLNDRRDWQLRSSLLDFLAVPCSIIGRAATQHFVLPCLESALVDVEDKVICSALSCLSTLVNAGLLSRSVLIDTTKFSSRNDNIHR